jgi:hypothetical protein
VTTFATPGGRCAIDDPAIRNVASGVSSEGFITTALPAAIAGATFQVMRRSG